MSKRFLDYHLFILFLEDLLPLEDDITIGFYTEGTLYDQYGKLLMGFKSFEDVKGKYFPDMKYLFVNLDLHNNLEELITIAHELRHAYQFEQVKSSECLEQEDITEAWRNEFDNYTGYQESTKYYNQFVEIDAHAFSYVLFGLLYNMPLQFNEHIDKNALKSRIGSVSQEYTLEDIKDCCQYTGFNPNVFNINGGVN